MNIPVPGRGCPLFRDPASIFVPRVFQAELRSQERAHVLIAIWVPFNQKISVALEMLLLPTPSLPRPTALKQRLPRRRPCLRKVTLNQWLCPPGDPRQRQEQLWPPRLCRRVPLAPGGQRPGCRSSSCDARDGPAAENGRPGNVGGAEAEEACPPPTYRALAASRAV